MVKNFGTQVSFILSQSTRLTDRETDRNVTTIARALTVWSAWVCQTGHFRYEFACCGYIGSDM